MFVSNELRKIAIERSRELRKQQTPAEIKLWQHLRDRRYVHHKLRRQHPVYYEENGTASFFVADFLIPDENLIIEIDGEIHRYQIAADRVREEILHSMGYRIIRFTNEEVQNDIEQVLRRVKEAIAREYKQIDS